LSKGVSSNVELAANVIPEPGHQSAVRVRGVSRTKRGKMFREFKTRYVVIVVFSAAMCLPFHTIARSGAGPAIAGGQSESIPRVKMDRSSIALGRLNPASLRATTETAGRRRAANRTEFQSPVRFRAFNSQIVAAQVTATAGSESTGSGDINEVEPNDQTAQNVFMPTNILGQIRPSRDQDFFAFPCLAGEQVNVEVFASRIPGSQLIADLGLFDSGGNLITESVGDGVNDPLIQIAAPADGIMFAGITDAEGLGGSNFVYLLSIDGGVDVDEVEPNSRIPQALPASDVTIFGQLTSSSDQDLYSITGTQGQSLIIDVDASVFGSTLVSQLTLTDPVSGIQYFSSDHNDGNDPRFNILLPFTGTYVIGVAPLPGSPGDFYRMNVSFVPGDNSPVITSVTHIGRKLIDITGTSLNSSSIVEVDGTQVKTTLVQKGELNAKAKAKTGAVITVANLPDLRRSNPLVVQ